jgi:cell division septation protein DedD
MGGWVVNVASSSQEDSIRQLQVKLKNSGVDTVMQRIGSKGEPRYRLRVTGFATSGEAKRYAAGLAQKSGINGAWASKR